jgi:Raf kinase inhibitor-like YbhB/YbcL family protein
MIRKLFALTLLTVLPMVVYAASTTAPTTAPAADPKAVTLTLTSQTLSAGQPIPRKHTGDGADLSPALAWANLPQGTRELALICDDPDAGDEPWVHWVICKIPADAKGLPESLPRKQTLDAPAGAVQGTNDWDEDNIGYRGPLPPKGHGVHRYHFKLYALDAALDMKPGFNKKDLVAAMKGHILAEGELVATYQR